MVSLEYCVQSYNQEEFVRTENYLEVILKLHVTKLYEMIDLLIEYNELIEQ